MDIEEKRKLWSLFKNVENKEEIFNRKQKTKNSDVLIVDFLNCVIRCFAANPQLDTNGEHVGAIVGTLKSIGYAIRQINPTRCILVCDGSGGSARRRKIFPAYKAKRKTRIKLNRSYIDTVTVDSEEKNLLNQVYKLVKYFDNLPVTVASVDGIEADDTIAYLSQVVFRDSESVTIMSTDKDFYQIVTDKIKVWSPTKKRIYGPNEILNEYGISAKNFIYYRILDGDVSDNISGVKGAGLATIKKCFPFLSEDAQTNLEEIIKHAVSNKNKYKIYQTLLDSSTIVDRNYKLMQLNTSIIPSYLEIVIRDISEKQIPKINKTEFLKLLINDSLQDSIPNPHVWLAETFTILNSFV